MAKLCNLRTAISTLSAALITTACTTPVTPDFSGMSAAYANLLEQYQLNSILSNIVRAAGERPLSFLDIPSINGSGNVTNNVGLSPTMNGFIGGLPGGPGGISSVGPSWSMNVGNSFNFSQSSLDNATFLRGFLSEIPIETAKYFITDNLPKELVFSLVVSSISIKKPDGTLTRYVNNPLLPEHADFQKMMYELLGKGLSIRPVANTPSSFASMSFRGAKGGKTNIDSKRKSLRELPAGPISMPQPPMANYDQSYYGAGGQSFYGNSLYNSYGYGAQMPEPGPKYKICLDVGSYSDFKQLEYAPTVYCNTSTLAINESASKKPELLITMRSPNSVFDYLGQVVTAQNQESPYMVTIPPSKTTPPRKIGQQNQYALLVVNRNSSTGRNFASITNLDGDVYSIPAKDNGYSPIVMKFVSQLLSLNKIPGSIPPSPAILMR